MDAPCRRAQILDNVSIISQFNQFPGFTVLLLGTPVIHQTIKRSTCRGNALLMLESLAPDVERSFPDPAGTYTPRDSAEEHYRGVHDRFERLYGAVVEGL